jgi:hypothetical protein
MIVIKDDNGALTRNGLPISYTKTNRKYVTLSYSNRKQYLCKCPNCFKNTYKAGFCREDFKNQEDFKTL